MREQKRRGFTLLELLVTLAISALILQLGVPSFARLMKKFKAEQDISTLRMIMSSSRQQALLRRQRVTLCPTTDTNCTSDWNLPLVLFTDTNNNRRVDGNEVILHTYAPSGDGVFRSFTGKVISFDARGFSGIYTGSLGYCMADIHPLSASFIVSRVGKVRKGGDSNGDGIAETAGQRNVPCLPESSPG